MQTDIILTNIIQSDMVQMVIIVINKINFKIIND